MSLDGGKIEIAGDSGFGLFGDDGTVTAKGTLSFSFYDSWTDPVIGLRGRFNRNKALYLTAESDVGGFGIGNTLTLQAFFVFHSR